MYVCDMGLLFYGLEFVLTFAKGLMLPVECTSMPVSNVDFHGLLRALLTMLSF